MKRIISFILSATMLTALLPTAFAADRITVADVIEAQEAVKIKNNAEDNEIFNTLEHDENIFADNVFMKFYTNCAKRVKDETHDEFVAVNCFDGADAKTAKISELIFNEQTEFHGTQYIYHTSGDNYYVGDLTIHNRGKSSARIRTNSYGEQYPIRLYFSPEDLAEVINENKLGTPKKILFLQLAYEDYLCDDMDGGVIVFVTDSGEYPLLNARYDNDRLSDYLLIDSEAFIEGMQGNTEKIRNVLYTKFPLEKAPVFSDITGDSAVDFLARMRIINGYEDGTFGGDKNITRAEAAKMIATLRDNTYSFDDYDCAPTEWTKFDFADVPQGHWARKYITYGVVSNYISGSGDKVGETLVTDRASTIDTDGNVIPADNNDIYIPLYNFYPENNVTEQELAKMIVCAIDSYADKMAGAEGGWPDGYIAVAKRLGITENATDKPATRLTAAHMIKNAYDAEVTNLSDDWNYTENENGGIVSSETIFGKDAYYNLDIFSVEYKRVKLTGAITGKTRENEYSFVVGKDERNYAGSYKKDDEVILLSKYGNLDGFIGKDCDIYCEYQGGNLVVIMAE